jgi:ethanolamine utilization protein EutN
MRTGEVIGRITLNRADPKLIGARFMIVQPYDAAALRASRGGTGEVEVVYDELGAGLGDRVGFSEGREAAMPFSPENVAIDAYLACLLDEVTFDKKAERHVK